MIIFIQAKLIYEAEMYRRNLSKIIVEFYNKSRLRVLERKDKKILMRVHMPFMNVEN